MKILFVGNLNEYTESYSKYVALRNLGHDVIGVSSELIPHYPGITRNMSIIDKLFNKCGIVYDKLGVNKKIMELIKHFEFDLLWSDKALIIKPETLLWIREYKPNIKFIFASGDNMTVKNFTGGHWEKTFKLFDFNITTKQQIVNKLRDLGCKEVIYSPKSYDRTWMETVDTKHKYGVTFVGSYEKERAESIFYLSNAGIKVDVWGNGWGKVRSTNNLIIHNKPLYKGDLVNVISMSKINLCFLRKLAKDEHTNRTFEIPAIGGFMLAERTGEHLEFFKEGIEAEYFSSNEELIKKVRYYLKHISDLEKISRNGRSRCLSEKYSYEDRILDVLNKVVNGQ